MRRRLNGSLAAVISALVLGAASTLGDWIWANYIEDGAVVPGVVHGLLFFVLLAIVLASSLRTPGVWPRLLTALPLMGVVIAAAFYPIAMVAGYLGGLITTWVAMWIGLASAVRWAEGGSSTVRDALVRGTLAAVFSGLAFWLISGVWTNPSAHSEPLSFERLGSWSFAFLPGMAALLIGRSPDQDSSAA